MFGITQQFLTLLFSKQDDNKLIAIQRTANSTVNLVRYKCSIKLPKKTINGEFYLSNALNPTEEFKFETTFNHGDAILNLNSRKDIEIFWSYLKEISDFKGGTVEMLESTKKIAKKVADKFEADNLEEEVSEEKTELVSVESGKKKAKK